MAQIHRATLDPGKLDLVEAWLSRQPWATLAGELTRVGAYRFDDPAGEVGVETFLVRSGDVVLQVPMTFRGAPLDGAEAFLMGTTEHSVLGTRWVYDGCGDPVWAATLTAAIRDGGRQAEELVETPDGPEARVPTVFVAGHPPTTSGGAGTEPADGTLPAVEQRDGLTVVRHAGVELTLARTAGALGDEPRPGTLVGHWADGDGVLAVLRTGPAVPDWYGQLSSALDTRMGFEVLELGAERVVGRMPVEGNTQPMGLWHGGASCVLAETLASIGAVAHALPDRLAVGVDLNATHHRSVRSGWVTGTATALRLGRTVAMYEVVLVDDDGRRVCTARVTCQLVAGPGQSSPR
ncbi:uncharacterized protein (TIGR00369 family) [Friedmanniella endophytica]|uniref:Uncharacterized protein (TIGR00369 family) n=1 Tax=Microlunatus kandeliicorticis TaxID=1759536 RepID=A0A7W3IS83_9ACTN|nr:hotdog fold thioesterase [Microlunatus kandeliicorticis]MBA8794291.1 uncharacterized protein (TIGR00369 family) [Microlunatus kandeliicorticis]